MTSTVKAKIVETERTVTTPPPGLPKSESGSPSKLSPSLCNDPVEKQKVVTYVRTEEQTNPESEVCYRKFGWVNLPAQMTHEGPS